MAAKTQTALDVQIEVLEAVIPMVCEECKAGIRTVYRSFDDAMFHGTVINGNPCKAQDVRLWLEECKSLRAGTLSELEQAPAENQFTPADTASEPENHPVAT